MPKVKQKKQRKPLGPLAIALIVLGGLCVMAAALILPKYLYDQYETYRDRPLAEGYEYVGRYHRSECVAEYINIKLLCGAVMPVDFYYFTTDTPPDQLPGSFPGWYLSDSASSETTSYYNYEKNGVSTPTDKFDMHSKSGAVTYSSYRDRATVTRTVKLRSSNKKYLISLYKEGYEKLTSKAGD